jgi:hypothetical protein
MGKFVSIPFQGAATTLPIPGAATVDSSGAITAVAVGTAGVGLTTAPIIVVTSTDGKGSGAIIVPVLTSNAVASYTVVSGGSGYTSASTVVLTVTWPPFIINSDIVTGVLPDVAGGAAGTSSITVLFNGGAYKSATLVFKTALSASAAIDQRNNLISALSLSTNVKMLDQVTPMTLTNGAVLSSVTLA